MVYTTHLEPSLDDIPSLSATLLPSSNSVAVFAAPSPAQKGTGASHDGQNIYFAAFDGIGNAAGAESSRQFAADSYTVFAGLQSIANTPDSQYALEEDDLQQRYGMPSAERCHQYSRIASLYRGNIMAHLERLEKQASALPEAADDEFHALLKERLHLKSIYTVFHLAQILYLPEDGEGNSPIGPELLLWLNKSDPAPSNADGLELASSAVPYENEDLFWSYVPRCVIRGLFRSASTLMQSLREHPLPFVSEGAETIAELLSSFPQVRDYTTSLEEAPFSPEEFVREFHRYKRRVKQAIREIVDSIDDPQMWNEEEEDVTEDEKNTWLARYTTVLNMLNGKEDIILGQAEDWREALACWGILVRPTLVLDDLRDVAQLIFESIPKEPDYQDSIVDEIQKHLLMGNPALAMPKCDQLDLWLSTHLTDILDKVNAIEADPEADYTFREWFILRYADQLQSDPGLWRMTLHYLHLVGEAGRTRLSKLVMHIPFADPTTKEKSKEDGRIEENETTAHDVIKACYDYGLQQEAEAICRRVAEKLISNREYGKAIAYCVQASDSRRIARIAEYLLEEYIEHGKDEFARLVDSIPTKLLHPEAASFRPQLFSPPPKKAATEVDMDDDAIPDSGEADQSDIFSGLTKPSPINYSVFHTKISFLAQYRDFHAFFAQGNRAQAAQQLVNLLRSGVSPKKFNAILLLDAIPLLEDEHILFNAEDTYELMRCAEDITGPIVVSGKDSAGSLTLLSRLATLGLKTQVSEERKLAVALQQLKVVRQALARNLARTFV